MKAKEEMMQGIQMAKEVAQKELSDQKTRYEERIKALEKELVHKFYFILKHKLKNTLLICYKLCTDFDLSQYI